MERDKSELFRTLYEEYLVPLKKLAVSMGVKHEDVEDLVHDSLLTYFEKYPMDWSDKQKKAMLARILHNKFIDSFRKGAHYADVDINDPEDAFLVVNRLMDKDALSYLVHRESYLEIQNLILGMKKDWREVIILYVIEERPIKEICEILGISGTVCRSRIARARKYLKEKLKDSHKV